MSRRRPVQRPTFVLAFIVAFVGACGGAAPDGTAAPPDASGGPAASAAASAASSTGTGPEGVSLVAYEDAADPAAPARHEQDLIRELRETAGMPALIGESGPAAFDTLDAIEAAYAQALLRDVAAAIDAGQLPGAAVGDPLAGQLASTAGQPPTTRSGPAAIDISLFANTGFTTSALMSMFVQVIQRANETGDATLPRQESFEETANGLRQQVDLRTTMHVNTGGGRVVADLTLTATVNIFDASGSFIALYTSTSSGHFDVSACPDTNGIAEGTYRFETKHELNDVGASAASRSGAGRSVDAPFRLVNGPDARLQRIEATLDLRADAHGPGAQSGSGPSGAFDWVASQIVQVTMPTSGGATTGSGAAATVTGSGGQLAAGGMAISSAMAQLFLGQIGQEAERYWRSGACIKVTVDPPSRDVSPEEQVTVTAKATHVFDGAAVDAPITASLEGTKRLDPADTPKDPPGPWTYEAGTEPGEQGTLQFTQTGRRGIGKATVTYTVKQDLLLSFAMTSKDGTLAGGLTSRRFSAADLPVSSAASGKSGRGTLELTFRLSGGGATCHADDTLPLDVTATAEPVPDQPDRVLVRLDYPLTAGSSPTMTCEAEGQTGSRQLPAPANASVLLVGLQGPYELTIGQPKTVTVTPSTGLTWTVNLTVTRPT